MAELAYTVVFDLDDTLYLERDFVQSGYTAASLWLRRHHEIDGLDKTCWALFCGGQRTKVFDVALEYLGLEHDPILIADLVSVYRSHSPSISLQPDAIRYLRRHPDQPRAMITDGPVATQMAKIGALGIAPYFQHIVCSDQWGSVYRKPHVRPYLSVEEWAQQIGQPLVYVADNAAKDFLTPKARGWFTVQILRKGRVHCGQPPQLPYQADVVIETLDELDVCLANVPTKFRTSRTI